MWHIHIKIESGIKVQTQKTAEELGLSLSVVMKAYRNNLSEHSVYRLAWEKNLRSRTSNIQLVLRSNIIKCKKRYKKKIKERISLFFQNPTNQLLNNHRSQENLRDAAI